MKYLVSILSLLVCSSNFAMTDFQRKLDGEFITLTGTVKNVKADSFNLLTDNHRILVEMDDYDWDSDGYKLVNGDKVVVRGRIDQDFLEQKKVEAGSVYVRGLDTYFFADSADEEGPHHYYSANYSNIGVLPVGADATVSGIVEKVVGREATVNTGIRKVKVDTSELAYNPMDNIGYVQIDVGDYVRASGQIDDNFFGKKELKADYIVEL